MKHLGPIPPGFAAIDGVLAIDGVQITELIRRAGNTPLFVYSKSMLTARVEAFRKAMPAKLALHYAVKANPFPQVVAHMAGLVDGFDIASAGELALLRSEGIEPRLISFAGPGKRDAELRSAIALGVTINLESEAEAARALAIAQNLGVRPSLAVRVNPSFGLKGSGMKMGGGAKPFGIDQDRVPALARKLVDESVDWQGFHIFAGSQSLDTDAIIETQEATVGLALQLADQACVTLPRCNIGGGLGIPLFAGDKPVDLQRIGAALADTLDRAPGETQYCMEMGRYLTGEAGVYLCRIVDRKISHGEVYLVTDGGLHHQLAASGNFGTVVRRNYPVAIATRFDAAAEEQASIVGCLCSPLDRLADSAGFPRAEAGDIVAVFCAGAYGASASPSAFLGHGPALEMLV